MRIQEAEQCYTLRANKESYFQCQDTIKFWKVFWDFKKAFAALD